ncbi:ribose-phosphate pyrophosphokinase [Sphingomonas sp. BN140010]|uniref:Ribose-phosphate pyrophosphokinase n=1 Tax=Sphingomonas arvum TaxID=2992113 RepID=A0ABT3JGK9_9SPHN|nr:ribose-phosphate pyrophosphokinase [Sphingomonas sp. BN140010]MCW3798149.1 ribose-phosphate pyrophosphokinase [Sphingomonas sp. BN140010]
MRVADPQEVRAHLLAAATAGTALTYSEVLERLGHRFTRPKMRALCKTLAAVDEAAEAAGEPELAVLVVRQSDGLPGQGWWTGSWEKHRFTGEWTGPAAHQLIDRLQRQAFDYWQARNGN